MKNITKSIPWALVVAVFVALSLQGCADQIRRSTIAADAVLSEVDATREAARDAKYGVIKRLLGELCDLEISEYNRALKDPEMPPEIAVALRACSEHREFEALMRSALDRVGYSDQEAVARRLEAIERALMAR